MPKPGRKNQHNGRHENGLVGPGKRITKQKSNGHINGSSRSAATEEPLPTTSSLDSVHIDGQAANETSAYSSDAKKDAVFNPHSTLKQRDSETSVDALDNMANSSGGLQNGSIEMRHRKSDVVPAKSKTSHDLGPSYLASTILRSWPSTDTVALLIFLMAMPSMILTIIQAFFASLTFMPPNGFSPGTMWSFLDLFHSPAGAPSYFVITLVDGICFVLWLCLWTWARRFALDLAQVQIALTLGGANSIKGNSASYICSAIVLLVHMVRSRGVRDFLFSNAVYTKLSSYPLAASILRYLPNQNDFGDSLEVPSTIRSIIAIHIVAQWILGCGRRYIATTSGTATAKTSKRPDTETLAGVQHSQELQATDSGTNAASASGVDYHPSPVLGLKDGKDKAISAKKRRRQANQIRSRQPFWAALASTKVHAMREYEHSKVNYKTSNSLDGTTQNPTTVDETVWITGVDSSTIHFEAMNIGLEWQDRDSENSASCQQPITVRINGAKWQLGLEEINETENDSGSGAQWRGEITGLAPNCTYECSFSRTYDDAEFGCISVKTPAISDKDLPKSLTANTIRNPGQPSSPITTIKNSIKSSEVKLAEARNRMTKTRRAHRSALVKLEKEVEGLTARVNRGDDDKKQQQKLLQAERSIKQTEEATADFVTQLEDLAAIPEEDSEEYTTKKKDFHERSASLRAANETLEAAKATASAEIATVNNELHNVTARKERLVSRQARLTEQYERITQANVQGLNEKERKAADSARKIAERNRMEQDLTGRIRQFQQQLEHYQNQTTAAWRELSVYDSQEQAQRDAMMRNIAPIGPEGMPPGAMPMSSTRPLGYGYGVPGTSIHVATTMAPVNEGQHSPFLAYANTLPDSGSRRARSNTNRSTGAGSNFSLDYDDADPIPPMPSAADFDIRGLSTGRKGSGSSRGKNNGSPGVIGTGLGSPIRGAHSPGQVKGIW